VAVVTRFVVGVVVGGAFLVMPWHFRAKLSETGKPPWWAKDGVVPESGFGFWIWAVVASGVGVYLVAIAIAGLVVR
jgi:hypothetical protein